MKSPRIIALSLLLGLAAGAALVLAADTSVSVTGEVIDSACYIKSGAKGPQHEGCASACAKAGIPLAVLEDKTDKVWMVISDKDAESGNAKLMPFVAKRVTVTGKIYEKGGQRVIEISSVKAAS